MTRFTTRFNERSGGQTLLVVAFLFLAFLTIGQIISDHFEDQRQAEELENVNTNLTKALLTSTDQTKAMIEQSKIDGQKPIIEPSEVPDVNEVLENGVETITVPKAGPRGASGERGDRGPGPTKVQIQAAVNSYCANDKCDGPSPSPGEVAEAVAQYCNDRGQCQGPQGTQGTEGAAGKDGDTGPAGPEGPAGPSPTAEQVLTAVTEFCGGGGCSGTTTLILDNCTPEAGMKVTGLESSGSPEDGYTLTCTKSADLLP